MIRDLARLLTLTTAALAVIGTAWAGIVFATWCLG